MSKSILVIDTPKHCSECPLLNGSDECTVQDDDANFNASDSWDELMRGCPLRKMPERKLHTAPVSNYELQKNLLADGWNACIDEITKNRGGNENGKSNF